MRGNLANVGVVLVVIATGLALGMIWGVRVSPYLQASGLKALAIAARPGMTFVVLLGCAAALYARTLRVAVPMLVVIGVTQLVVSIAYGVLVWVPHSSFLRPPVG